MAETKVHCPNCNGPAIREGDEITCEKCDAVFVIKQKEPKVVQIGRLNELEQRVGSIETLLRGVEPKKEDPKPPKEEAPKTDDGFIVGHGR